MTLDTDRTEALLALILALVKERNAALCCLEDDATEGAKLHLRHLVWVHAEALVR